MSRRSKLSYLPNLSLSVWVSKTLQLAESELVGQGVQNGKSGRIGVCRSRFAKLSELPNWNQFIRARKRTDLPNRKVSVKGLVSDLGNRNVSVKGLVSDFPNRCMCVKAFENVKLGESELVCGVTNHLNGSITSCPSGR